MGVGFVPTPIFSALRGFYFAFFGRMCYNIKTDENLHCAEKGQEQRNEQKIRIEIDGGAFERRLGFDGVFRLRRGGRARRRDDHRTRDRSGRRPRKPADGGGNTRRSGRQTPRGDHGGKLSAGTPAVGSEHARYRDRGACRGRHHTHDVAVCRYGGYSKPGRPHAQRAARLCGACRGL